jgi:hypothetical protein
MSFLDGPMPDDLNSGKYDVESTQGLSTEPSPNEISEKISKMLPDMGVIKKTGILKNTESHKESKKILTNFQSGLKNMTEDDIPKYNYEWEKSDNRNALDQSTDSIYRVVGNMVKVGIDVPQIYKDFLHSVRPPKKQNDEIVVESKPPLYSIRGLDDSGQVDVRTQIPLEIKKGNTTILLDKERLKKAVTESVSPNLRKCDKTLMDCYEKTYDKESDSFDTGKTKITAECCEDLLKIKETVTNKPTIVPSKNAYEIRLSVLELSIGIIKSSGPPYTIENIINTANTLYKFVENKK